MRWLPRLASPPESEVGAAPAAVDAYLTEQWVAAPGAADALARLESSGHGLAVIANSPHGKVEEWMTDAGLCSTSGPLSRVACVLARSSWVSGSQIVGSSSWRFAPSTETRASVPIWVTHLRLTLLARERSR